MRKDGLGVFARILVIRFDLFWWTLILTNQVLELKEIEPMC